MSVLRDALWTDTTAVIPGAADVTARCTAASRAPPERQGTRIEDFDAAIAAHALAVDGSLVTASRDHMDRVPGLRVEDWSIVIGSASDPWQ
jgi:predicted nucleic acid-binding protein